jgi:hypothetical protein
MPHYWILIFSPFPLISVWFFLSYHIFICWNLCNCQLPSVHDCFSEVKSLTDWRTGPPPTHAWAVTHQASDHCFLSHTGCFWTLSSLPLPLQLQSPSQWCLVCTGLIRVLQRNGTDGNKTINLFWKIAPCNYGPRHVSKFLSVILGATTSSVYFKKKPTGLE